MADPCSLGGCRCAALSALMHVSVKSFGARRIAYLAYTVPAENFPDVCVSWPALRHDQTAVVDRGRPVPRH